MNKKSYLPTCTTHGAREGVRGVAGVAMATLILQIMFHKIVVSAQADNRYVSVLAYNWFCRYGISLSVSVIGIDDLNAHIGSLTNILKSNFLNKRLYFKNILILKVKKKHQMWVCKSIPQVPNFFLFQEKIIFYFIFYRNVLFIVYQLSVSVSADMGKFISVFIGIDR